VGVSRKDEAQALQEHPSPSRLSISATLPSPLVSARRPNPDHLRHCHCSLCEIEREHLDELLIDREPMTNLRIESAQTMSWPSWNRLRWQLGRVFDCSSF
jgi:hypothetical protein